MLDGANGCLLGAADDSDDADNAHDEHGWMNACYESESDVR